MSTENQTVTTTAPTTSAPTSTSAVFNWSRFALLAKAHWAENRSGYMGFFFVLAAVYFVVMLVGIPMSSGDMFDIRGQYFMYYFGLIVSGYLFASRYFKGLQQRGSGLVLLMQPASTFEKWLLAVLWILVLFPALYTLLFQVMTFPAREVAKAVYSYGESAGYLATLDERFEHFIPFVQHTRLDDLTAFHQCTFWIVYIAATAFALLASLYFRSASTIKGLILLLVLFLLSGLLGNLFAGKTTLFILGFWFEVGEAALYRQGFGAGFVFNVILFWFVMPLLLWVASFFGLKERDVL